MKVGKSTFTVANASIDLLTFKYTILFYHKIKYIDCFFFYILVELLQVTEFPLNIREYL